MGQWVNHNSQKILRLEVSEKEAEVTNTSMAGINPCCCQRWLFRHWVYL